MRRLGVIFLLLCVVVVVGVMGRGWAEQRSSGDPVGALQREVAALRAELDALKAQHQTLRTEFDKLRTAFRRHTHAVKFWDPKRRKATPWTDPGSFFITLPRIAAGESDKDAVAAGGTWGTP